MNLASDHTTTHEAKIYTNISKQRRFLILGLKDLDKIIPRSRSGRTRNLNSTVVTAFYPHATLACSQNYTIKEI